jgi:hypothetical protein
MSRARHILAVVAVTTALCADQVIAAAPMARPQVADMAARLVTRLSQTFRRTVPNAVRPAVRSRYVPSEAAAPVIQPDTLLALNCELSPFQFRLPPPGF